MNGRRLTRQEIEVEPTMSEFERQSILELLRYDPRLYMVRLDDGQLMIVGLKLNEKGVASLERGRALMETEEGRAALKRAEADFLTEIKRR